MNLELFQKLPQERLEWACDRGETIELPKGEYLIKEGESPRGFFILVCGRVSITRHSEGVEMPIGQHDSPSFFGEIQVLTEEPYGVSLRALNDCHLYEISGEDFRTLLHECRDFERRVFRVVQTRLQGLESFLRNREKMAALGTLSAGLAHELNNPAAALVRALKDVMPALRELERMNLVYGQRNIDEAHTQKWQQLRDRGYENLANNGLDPLTLSQREDELLDWLEDYGVEKPWNLSEPLALGGIEVATLKEMMEPWRNDRTELRDQGIRWLALSFEVMVAIQNGLQGAEHISELVQSMKSYTYLDRGPQQVVDVCAGLEDTLRLFCHKIKQGIEVRRCYTNNLPKIMGYGSELNQVWTSLIDNAIDAIEGTGVLEVKTDGDGSYAIVEIIDSGKGISPEIQSRVYEPFFTTKEVGQGSGLGLDAVRRIVENRHQGTISFDSQPGKTCFRVCLPMANG
ncbi:MAG: ATP-binding protein [Spirulinaceae cyanobacterium]